MKKNLKKATLAGHHTDLNKMQVGEVNYIIDYDTECDGFLIEKLDANTYTVENAWETDIKGIEGVYSTVDDDGGTLFDKVKVTFNKDILTKALTFDFPEFDGGNDGFTYENLKAFSAVYAFEENPQHELAKYVQKIA